MFGSQWQVATGSLDFYNCEIGNLYITDCDYTCHEGTVVNKIAFYPDQLSDVTKNSTITIKSGAKANITNEVKNSSKISIVVESGGEVNYID